MTAFIQRIQDFNESDLSTFFANDSFWSLFLLSALAVSTVIVLPRLM
ncbi:hypothetical protein AAKU67_002778 [Oxalobacteraceae bacterium GrIS 2.11]